ncbi:MAG: hypothetical protein JW726_13500 [Anaerolineales bacterium]|nr:hypothetical protein [Anaerolineales bacterium]
MKKNLAYILLSVVIPLTAISTLFILLGCARPNDARSVLAAPLEIITPSVLAVEPVFAPNDLDTPAVILGTGFAAVLSGTQVITPPTAYLGNAALSDVIWVSTTTLSATVPWGLEPGAYTLTVANPDGGTGSLPNAFTVTQGIGVWTTNGPYGGHVGHLEIHPLNPNTIFAWLGEVGTFVSYDSGAHWELVLRNLKHKAYFEFDAQDADVFYTGDVSNFYRTLDNAQTWEIVNERAGGWPYYAPAAHPTLPGVIIAAFTTGDFPDLEGGIFRSDDYGSNWYLLTNELTDTHITSLAIHPVLTQTLLAGTANGNLFYSLDGGTTWDCTFQLPGPVSRVYFNPFEPLQAWATTGGWGEVDEPQDLYRSEDLLHWIPISVDENITFANRYGWDMDFASGTIWATTSGSYFSTDGGDIWTPLSTDGCDPPWQLEINPENPLEMYGAPCGRGVCKSVDGGLNWQPANEGLAGIIPGGMAVSPSDPDTLYVRAGLDLVKSNNGGQSWRVLLSVGGSPAIGLAVDPFDPDQVYAISHSSNDGGETWHPMIFTLPITYCGWLNDVPVVAPHPSQPGRVLAVVSIWPEEYSSVIYGLIYATDDYGEHWRWLEGALLPAWTGKLAYDAVDPNLVYAATSGAGAWKSGDGGQTWQVMLQPGGQNIISEVLAHPAIASKVYAWYQESDQSRGLYVSEDAGETWTFLLDPATPPLFFSPAAPYWLYGACSYDNLLYLCRSRDGGYNWGPVIEVPTFIQVLDGGTDGERLILYIGTAGGFVSSLPGVQITSVLDTIPGRGNLLGAGVYRLTTRLPTEWVYLPLLSRVSVP